MSAFVVDPAHIDYLVSAAVIWRPDQDITYREERIDSFNAERIGRELLRENVYAVRCRYPDSPTLPGPVPTPDPDAYTFHPVATIDPLWVIQASWCYDYQTSEDPFYDDHPVCAFMRELREAAMRHLPGMADAPWEITPEVLAGRG